MSIYEKIAYAYIRHVSAWSLLLSPARLGLRDEGGRVSDEEGEVREQWEG